MRPTSLAIVFIGLLSFAASAFGQSAPDFPPGPFTDGGHYQLSDFKGKVLVLYFFEST